MRKYLKRMLSEIEEEVNNGRNGFSCGGEAVVMFTDGNDDLTVVHHETTILQCNVYTAEIKLIDGWSATDQTIINACFEFFDMPYKCKRHGETLSIQDVTA